MEPSALRNRLLQRFICIQSNCQIDRFIGVFEVILSIVYFEWATFSEVYFCLVVQIAYSNFNFKFLNEIFELNIRLMMMMIYAVLTD